MDFGQTFALTFGVNEVASSSGLQSNRLLRAESVARFAGQGFAVKGSDMGREYNSFFNERMGHITPVEVSTPDLSNFESVSQMRSNYAFEANQLESDYEGLTTNNSGKFASLS